MPEDISSPAICCSRSGREPRLFCTARWRPQRHWISRIGLWKFAGGTPMRAILATTFAILAASPLYAETLDDLYAKAKQDGALSIYGGGPSRLYEGWIKEFEAKFPGVKVTLKGGYAGGLAPEIDRQIAAKRLEVDFVTFQAVQEFIRWKREGVLLPFRFEGYDALDPRFRDADGAYTSIAVFA